MLNSNCSDSFTDNYFIFFRLFVCLLTLESTTCEQVVCSRKMGYSNTLPLGTNSCKKRNVATLNSAAHVKQKRCVTCRSGWNDSRVLYIAFSESCQPNRNLFGVRTKLKESIFKSSNQRDVVNAIFLEYSKEDKLSPRYIGIRNIPSDICYDKAKHY